MSVPFVTTLLLASLITPLVTVEVLNPSATMLLGDGVRLMFPAGTPGTKVIVVLPVALPRTEVAVTVAVPTVVADRTTKVMTPPVVVT
jgi:hypothetical protein